jgi:Spy/CpxP family protein refolding chaperone
MKRIILIAVLASLVASGVSFAAIRWLAVGKPPPVAVGSIHDLAWLQGQLQLSQDQMSKIQGLADSYREVIGDCCQKHCGARFDLSEELALPSVDLAKAKACVDAMSAAQATAEKATLDHILKVREILTPSQQKVYAELINKQVCTACPTGAHHP